MKAGEWTALLTAIAGVLAALAAIPAGLHRTAVLVGAAALVASALAIAGVSLRRVPSTFTIDAPRADQVIVSEIGGIVVRGTVPDLHSDTLWVFEEGRIGGQRVWLFGGEALVGGGRWSFDYEPSPGRPDRSRRTLSVVRAGRDCERQLRSIRADDAGRLVVYNPTSSGCEVLGQVSMVVAARA